MNLCSENHKEVCHEGPNCPACQLVTEREELIKEINTARDEIESLKEQIP